VISTPDNNQALHKQAVESAVAELSSDVDPSWEGVGFILGGAGLVDYMLELMKVHPRCAVGTFDLSESMFEAFNDGRLKFGIDQQPFLQGVLPVYLLTYGKFFCQS
jgi:ABC-type sugar transport system substrate-binding protein